MQVEPITYVMNCENTACVNLHYPIVLQIEKEIIKAFDDMLDEIGLDNYFLDPLKFNQKYSTHIQYINAFGDIDLVEIKSSINETLGELSLPIVGYRLLIKNQFEIPLDDLTILPYSYPYLDKLKFYCYHRV